MQFKFLIKSYNLIFNDYNKDFLFQMVLAGKMFTTLMFLLLFLKFAVVFDGIWLVLQQRIP